LRKSWGYKKTVTYSIDFEPAALRQFKRLNRDVQARLTPKIRTLAENPRPRDAKKLQGYENTYRIRVGDYRVIYEVHDNILLVLVVKVGPRRDIYRS
jgi:mRNA interferase RelE/StbE